MNLQHIKVLAGHTGRVNSVVFSPDGRTLASGSGFYYDRISGLAEEDVLKIWEVKSGQEIINLKGHTKGVTSVAFSPDGKTLATGSHDQTIKIWDVESGVEIGCFTGHRDHVWAGGVSSVAFSSDGHTLASGSWDGSIKLWDTADESQDWKIKNRKNKWENSNGRLKKTLLSSETNCGVASISYSPNGQTIASGTSNKTVELWDVKLKKLLHTFTGHIDNVCSVAFSPDGSTLASGSWDGTIKLWDLTTLKEIATLTGHSDIVCCVAFSPNGKTLASGGYDTTITLWGLPTLQESAIATGHSDYVKTVAFSPNGQTLASGSGDKIILLWNITE